MYTKGQEPAVNAFLVRNQEQKIINPQQNRHSQHLEDHQLVGRSNLPPPPAQPALPPLAVEKTDGWSCHRCTLLNYNAQIWCEACGGKRLDTAIGAEEELKPSPVVAPSKLSLAIEESELDVASEDAPPRVGHVLDKLVLFSAIEAKAKETPSLQRRSGEFGWKLHHNQHQHFGGSTAMVPIDENPLQRTLERITHNQAQLVKSNEYFKKPLTDLVNSNRMQSSPLHRDGARQQPDDPAVNQQSTAVLSQAKSQTQTHLDIIRQQECLLEEARKNLIKQQQNVENFSPLEQAKTLPRPEPNFEPLFDKETSNSFPSLIATEANLKPEKQPESMKSDQKPAEILLPGSAQHEIRASSGPCFDFTKTPRSFLASNPASNGRKASTGNMPPRLEILSASITRKYSETESDAIRQARLHFFSKKQDSNTSSNLVTSNVEGDTVSKSNIRTEKDNNSLDSKLELGKPTHSPAITKAAKTGVDKERSIPNLEPMRTAQFSNKNNPIALEPNDLYPKEEKSIVKIMPAKVITKGIAIPEVPHLQGLLVETAAPPVVKMATENQGIPQSNANKENVITKDIDSVNISDCALTVDTKRKQSPTILNNQAEETIFTTSSQMANYKSMGSKIPVPVVQAIAIKAQDKTLPLTSPQCPPKKRDLQHEPYYSSPVSPPRPVTPPRPVLPPKKSVTQVQMASPRQSVTPPRPASPALSSGGQKQSPPLCTMNSNVASAVHRQQESTVPLSMQIFSAQSMNDINRALMSRPASSRDMAIRPQQPSQLQRSSLSLNERELNHADWLPQRSYTPLVPLNTGRGAVTSTYQRPFSRLSAASSPLRDFELSDYSVYDMNHDYIPCRTPSLLDSRCASRIGSLSIMSENNYSAITPEVSRKLSLSVKTEPKFPKDFGFVSSNIKKELMPKPPRRRGKDASNVPGYSSSRPASHLSNNSSREETPVNSPIFRPKECGCLLVSGQVYSTQ